MSELDLYDYELPPELIAREPAARRDDARLLVYHRLTGQVEHRGVRDLPEYLRPNDLLVLNDTQVIPARLVGYREATGGRWSGLFLHANPAGTWEVIGQTRGRLRPGEYLIVPQTQSMPSAKGILSKFGSEQRSDILRLKLIERGEEGNWLAEPDPPGCPFELLQQFGQVPLPPYMERDNPTETDRERYQTLYARHPGSVAAPTAGLHFTTELLQACADRGVQTTFVTLHVGIGTFRPVTADRLSDHVMHAEWCQVTDATAQTIQQTRSRGGRVVAVGTTSVRTLETASQSGVTMPFSGPTQIFIRPPYEFRAVDVLLTNFHLPKSTLLVLLSAFMNRQEVLSVYQQAVAKRYRFFSYGDAMLVV